MCLEFESEVGCVVERAMVKEAMANANRTDFGLRGEKVTNGRAVLKRISVVKGLIVIPQNLIAGGWRSMYKCVRGRGHSCDRTLTEFLSTRVTAVDQLKRTIPGKPKTGWHVSRSHDCVLGSDG